MTNLEKLLLKINDVKSLTEQQQQETLRVTLQDETKNFIKESLEQKDKAVVNEDIDNDYTEEVVGGSPDASADLELGADDDGLGDDAVDLPSDGDTVSTDGSMDASTELSTPDTTGAEEEQILDLSNATVDEVLAQLENLPDDTVIEIKKNAPTFDVTANSSSITESDDKDDSCDECLDEEIDQWIEESLKEEAGSALVEEYKVMLAEYESKLKKLQTESTAKINLLTTQLQEATKNVQTLTEQQSEYNKALTQATEFLDEMTIRNTNLLHITKLFTEQTVSKQDKINIAKQFDTVKTINESTILYNALSETLPKVQKAAQADIQTIKEEIQSVKKEVLKEEKTYNDPDFERFEKLIKHKI